MTVKSELLQYWEEGKAIEGYNLEEEDIVKDPLHQVEDELFAFILGLLY
ncbi:MAG: hypothetical protein GX357_00305 [Firmicutes bacterium]|nr:hypothetical protein [Bacillota bacterium]